MLRIFNNVSYHLKDDIRDSIWWLYIYVSPLFEMIFSRLVLGRDIYIVTQVINNNDFWFSVG